MFITGRRMITNKLFHSFLDDMYYTSYGIMLITLIYDTWMYDTGHSRSWNAITMEILLRKVYRSRYFKMEVHCYNRHLIKNRMVLVFFRFHPISNESAETRYDKTGIKYDIVTLQHYYWIQRCYCSSSAPNQSIKVS